MLTAALLAALAVVLVVLALLALPSIRIIGATEVGLVTKRFARSKFPEDNLIAFRGEPGYKKLKQLGEGVYKAIRDVLTAEQKANAKELVGEQFNGEFHFEDPDTPNPRPVPPGSPRRASGSSACSWASTWSSTVGPGCRRPWPRGCSTQPRPRKGPVWQAPPTERVTGIFARRGLPQLAQVRQRAEALKSRALPWITPAALLIWIALSQVSVLFHAWSWWKH